MFTASLTSHSTLHEYGQTQIINKIIGINFDQKTTTKTTTTSTSNKQCLSYTKKRKKLYLDISHWSGHRTPMRCGYPFLSEYNIQIQQREKKNAFMKSRPLLVKVIKLVCTPIPLITRNWWCTTGNQPTLKRLHDCDWKSKHYLLGFRLLKKQQKTKSWGETVSLNASFNRRWCGRSKYPTHVKRKWIIYTFI